MIAAAGAGFRYGKLKQLELLNGRRVIDWSVSTAKSVADGVVVVLPSGVAAEIGASLGVDRVVVGGATRTASVRAGIEAVPADATVIVVHDAARPLASRELFERVIEVLEGDSVYGTRTSAMTEQAIDGVVPGVEVPDTLKRVDRSSSKVMAVLETVDRDGLLAVQTPQAFVASVLRRAHSFGRDTSDDAGLVEAAGGNIVVVPGEAVNVKITLPEDLNRLSTVVQ